MAGSRKNLRRRDRADTYAIRKAQGREMTNRSAARLTLLAVSFSALVACDNQLTADDAIRQAQIDAFGEQFTEGSSVFDLFGNQDDPNVTVEVNRYIWNAALDILDFMPIESVDPFSGVIVYGFGTPPGSGRAYRATVFVRDPALDARSLNVALMTRSGPASTETVRAIEDAILTRARQLRVRDGGL
jgi:hypothetical protein